MDVYLYFFCSDPPHVWAGDVTVLFNLTIYLFSSWAADVYGVERPWSGVRRKRLHDGMPDLFPREHSAEDDLEWTGSIPVVRRVHAHFRLQWDLLHGRTIDGGVELRVPHQLHGILFQQLQCRHQRTGLPEHLHV